MALTPKQARFVEEYCIDWNATQAAIRAGYSEKTAQEIGAENLSKPIIADAIEKHRDRISEKAEVDAAWVLRRLKIEAKRTGKGSQHAARIRATELIGKIVRAFPADEVKLKHGGDPDNPTAIETNGNIRITVTKRIEQLSGALDSVASRAIESGGDVAGDGIREPMDS
jgi:hypothetical protein